MTPERKRPRLRYRHRLLGGMLVLFLPMMVVLAWWLTARAASSLTDASLHRSESVAGAVALRLQDWIDDRSEAMAILATRADTLVDVPSAGASLAELAELFDFESLVITDANGDVLAESGSGDFDPSQSDWFDTVADGEPIVTSPVVRDGAIEWVVAHPVLGSGGRFEGVVAGYLDVARLTELLDPELEADTNVALLDPNGVLVYDTNMGEIPDAAALIAAGGLSETIDNPAIRAASSERGSSAQYTDQDGHEVIGGTATVADRGWIVLAHEDTDDSLAPVRDQKVLAFQLVGVGTVVAVVAAWLFARFESKRLVTFAESTRTSGVEVNSAASELSAASDELAATTTQQSAAVTQASATTEELARASSAIAETVDEVAGQTAETRANLEQAEHDIQLSNERTVALASRVNEIGGLLTLINQIADHTGLLALNAAIEAARAGEDGRGFAVVAEEVRRLAESSKTSAADIEVIVDAVHAETNATVMAMEKGAKQMQQGLVLLDQVTDATDQVRLTTQQQRSATAQVVETMEQLTDASRQVAITAQQIAGAAGSLAQLAGNLESTATAAKDRY